MRLDPLFAEFDGLDPEERLELLMEFGEELAPLTPEQSARYDAGDCRVTGCQTPVFLWIAASSTEVQLAAEVPEKSPTVRGFVGLLVSGLNGATPTEVLEVPDDIVGRLGLTETLGMTRHHGFSSIVAHLKREAAPHRETA